MATAAERTELIQLVVGMVGAAPGADILAELVGVIDGGVTIDELAVAIYENPIYSGETATALFPAFEPNEIFAERFLASLLGDEVSADVMAGAVAFMTGQLNGGVARGVAAKGAIDILAASTLADSADAKSALANKVAVAEYYSVTLEESSKDLADLMAVVADVDSSATAVAAGNAAVDNVIAANQGLTGLISRLDVANKAKALFLVGADGDGNALTSTDAKKIGAAVTAAQEATGDAIAENTVPANAALYTTKASPELQAALISAAQAALGAKLLAANKKLVDAQGNALLGGTNSVPGLEAAILADAAADAAVVVSEAAKTLASEALAGAVAGYDAVAANDDLEPIVNSGVTIGFTDVIKLTGRTLSVEEGITEATNPGVTALFTALQTNLLAMAAGIAAVNAADQTKKLVDNLDLNDAGKMALEELTEAISSFEPSSATKATVAEIYTEITALALSVKAANAAEDRNTAGAEKHKMGIDKLRKDIDGVDITTPEGHDLLTRAATGSEAVEAVEAVPAAGGVAAVAAVAAVPAVPALITEAVAMEMDAAFAAAIEVTDATAQDAQDASLAVLYANSVVDRQSVFITLEKAYGIAAAANSLTDKYGIAVDEINAVTDDISALNIALAVDAAAVSVAADLKTALARITDAEKAFAPVGIEVPEDVDQILEFGTAKDDIFLGGNAKVAQIFSFKDDDLLFVGADTVLNTDAKAGANGNNAALEVWITGTSNAVITVESSAFGSAAATPEIYTITLSGVAAADVSYADGFISIG